MLDSTHHRPACNERLSCRVRRQTANACNLATDVFEPDPNRLCRRSEDPDRFALDGCAQKRMKTGARSIIDLLADRVLQCVERVHERAETKITN